MFLYTLCLFHIFSSLNPIFTHHDPFRVHNHICTAKVNTCVECLFKWSAFKNKYSYQCIMWNNLVESAEHGEHTLPCEDVADESLQVGQYLGGVWTLHVWLSTVVDSPLKHLFNSSHQEDIWMRARYWEHSLLRQWKYYNKFKHVLNMKPKLYWTSDKNKHSVFSF